MPIVPGGIVVVGSANADIYIEVASVPKVGETVDGQQTIIGPGGKGSNQAAAAGRYLTHPTPASSTEDASAPAPRPVPSAAWVGKLGTDAHASMFLSGFASCNVDASLAENLSSHPTGQAFIILDSRSHNSIIICLGANEQWGTSSSPLTPAELSAVTSAGAVLLQREIPDAVNLAVARAAAAAGVPAMLDVGGRASPLDEEILPYLAYISLNETELARVVGKDVVVADLADPAAAAAAAAEGRSRVDPAPLLVAVAPLLAKGVGRVLLTLGEHGGFVFARGENGDAVVEASVCAAEAKEIVDTTGAGDCFRGVFAAALCVEKTSVTEALRAAAAASALCIGVKGTLPSMPTRESVDAVLEKKTE